MKTDLVIINEYCNRSHIDPEFIMQLEDEGLIQINIIDNEQYLDLSEINKLDRYVRLHYDLSVNVEGISVVQHLLENMEEMRKEILHLRQRMRLLDDDLFF